MPDQTYYEKLAQYIIQEYTKKEKTIEKSLESFQKARTFNLSDPWDYFILTIPVSPFIDGKPFCY